MARYNENPSDQNFGFGLKVTVERPLDPRLIVDDVADLYGFGNVVYKGMAVSVINEGGAIYVCVDASKKNEAAGWKVQSVSSIIDSSTQVVKSEFLPSYVDDVLEGYYHEETVGETPIGKFYKTRTGEGTPSDPFVYTEPYKGEKGKIYVDLSNEFQYRWSGQIYVVISDMDAITDAEIDATCVWL